MNKDTIRDILHSIADVLQGEVAITDLKKHAHSVQDTPPLPGSIEFFDLDNTKQLKQFLSITNPGVVMVAVQHYVQLRSLRKEIIISPSRLFKQQPWGESLRKFAHLASFLVRLSDDWGDKKEDEREGSPNLFLTSSGVGDGLALEVILKNLLPEGMSESDLKTCRDDLYSLKNGQSLSAQEAAKALLQILVKAKEAVAEDLKNEEEPAGKKCAEALLESLLSVSYLAIDLGTQVNDADFDTAKK